jgi:Transposase
VRALTAFAQWLHEIAGGDPGQAAIAIEVPRGVVVETLVEHGFHLYAINPKQLDRFRDRHSVAGAKDDRGDAFVLSGSLRTDRARFRRIRLDVPLVIQLRELSRVDEDLGHEANRLTNRLREQLHRSTSRRLSCVLRLTNRGCGPCLSWRLRPLRGWRWHPDARLIRLF